jgi:hypothetical protein
MSSVRNGNLFATSCFSLTTGVYVESVVSIEVSQAGGVDVSSLLHCGHHIEDGTIFDHKAGTAETAEEWEEWEEILVAADLSQHKVSVNLEPLRTKPTCGSNSTTGELDLDGAYSNKALNDSAMRQNIVDVPEFHRVLEWRADVFTEGLENIS